MSRLHEQIKHALLKQIRTGFLHTASKFEPIQATLFADHVNPALLSNLFIFEIVMQNCRRRPVLKKARHSS